MRLDRIIALPANGRHAAAWLARGALAIVALALCAAVGAHTHAAGAEGDRAPAASSASGQRHVPDAPLVQGMRRVKAAAAELARPYGGQRDRARVLAQADAIQQAIDTIFAECRLEPEPDAALHPILASLLGAVGALRVDTGDVAAVAEIRKAVADYEALFGPLP